MLKKLDIRGIVFEIFNCYITFCNDIKKQGNLDYIISLEISFVLRLTKWLFCKANKM